MTNLNRIALHTGKQGGRFAKVVALVSVFEKSDRAQTPQKITLRKKLC